MVKFGKIARYVVHIAATVFLAIQMVVAVDKYRAKLTMRSPEMTTLSKFRKPLLFTVCKLDQFNYPQAKALGYSRADNFLSGNTMDNSKISWTGLHGNMSFNQTLNMLYNPTNNITFFTNPHFETLTSQKSSKRFFIPFGLCSVYENIPQSFIRIHLDVREVSSHIIFVSDPASSTSFQPSVMKGDQILLKTTSINGGAYTMHKIQLKETRVEIGDDYCTAYPTEEFMSYSDCVEAEMREKIVPTLGCMVPWLSDKDVCLGSRERLPKHEPLVQWLFRISLQSWGNIIYTSEQCPPPCSYLTAHSTTSFSGFHKTKNAVELYFVEQVEVEKILLAYDSEELLVEIGSCLGLWLGLSVIGIYDIVVILVQKSVQNLKLLYLKTLAFKPKKSS